MKPQIPIYRAKKSNSDEYVEGCFNIWEQNGKIYHSIMDIFEFPSPYSNIHIIDITTLAIHFPSMVDSQGTKIFASLSEDGRGGDIFQYNKLTAYRELDNAVNTVVINQGRHALLIGDNFHSLFAIQGKVTGVQQ